MPKRAKELATVHYNIELRCVFAKKRQRKEMERVAKVTARHLYTQAVLLAEIGTAPDIALFSDAFWLGRKDLMKGGK
ncbi:MAG TPA: hypothetical protein VGU68_02310 [Ktedonobacteraceae bacterium]|nr:hypothetical protein [Ktedonobacteraceae bacterium]